MMTTIFTNQCVIFVFISLTMLTIVQHAASYDRWPPSENALQSLKKYTRNWTRTKQLIPKEVRRCGLSCRSNRSAKAPWNSNIKEYLRFLQETLKTIIYHLRQQGHQAPASLLVLNRVVDNQVLPSSHCIENPAVSYNSKSTVVNSQCVYSVVKRLNKLALLLLQNTNSSRLLREAGRGCRSINCCCCEIPLNIYKCREITEG